ncbi:MAG: class I SAM-dependent methyltransferase [Lactobacillaceae bacterium]|jgi:SAM-dependent methyltransferase|nr:class I SAM-dependent methyltransferase [Lactobacillaceae bacterium]
MTTQNRVAAITAHMFHGAHEAADDIQLIQTKHRVKLIDAWQIKPGMHILEIGSGQGDMTAALAYTVGATGSVTAIDIAPEVYGAPFTIGQGMHYLQQSAIGANITAYFNTDLLVDAQVLAGRHFDAIVFAHSSWYFASQAQFQAMLSLLKPMADYLYYAEWDLELSEPAQFNHYLAATVQAQFGAFQTNQQANIRTLISKFDFANMVANLPATIIRQASFDAEDMQDGNWEVGGAKYFITPKNLATTDLDAKTKQLLLTQIGLMTGPTKALDTYWAAVQLN